MDAQLIGVDWQASLHKTNRRGACRSAPALCYRRVRPKAASDRLFQVLRGAEGDLLARLDLDGFAGGRVAAHARGALAHLKDAEAADADALALLQMLDDVVYEIGEHHLRLLLRHLMG